MSCARYSTIIPITIIVPMMMRYHYNDDVVRSRGREAKVIILETYYHNSQMYRNCEWSSMVWEPRNLYHHWPNTMTLYTQGGIPTGGDEINNINSVWSGKSRKSRANLVDCVRIVYAMRNYVVTIDCFIEMDLVVWP